MDIGRLKITITQMIRNLHKLQNEAQQGCDTVVLDQTRVGRLSRMDAMQSQAMNQEAQRRRSVEIERLENALHQLDADDYGYCQLCDELISEGRLLLDPAASYCIKCAEKLEHKA